MTSPARRAGRPRGGRRAGDSGTREAILDAARTRFSEHGYDGATIRGIAAGAGVDPALVHHFYGSKERLFAAAMRLPVVPSEILTAALAAGAEPDGAEPDGAEPDGADGDAADGAAAGTGGMGAHLVRTALATWERPEVQDVFLGLLRSALTSEQAAGMFREFIADAILRPVAALARGGQPEAGGGAGGAAGTDGGPADPQDAAYRASAIASQMLGLALTRYLLRLEPIASADAADLAATIGPTIDRYLTGDIRAAGPAS